MASRKISLLFDTHQAVEELCSLDQHVCSGKQNRATGEDIVANCFHSVSNTETIGVLRNVILLMPCDTAGVVKICFIIQPPRCIDCHTQKCELHATGSATVLEFQKQAKEEPPTKS